MNRFTALGVRALGRSEVNLWVVCLAAFYTDNYSEFGEAVNRSRSTVSRWAAAYGMYVFLRGVVPHNIRRLRKALSVKHFYTLAELFRRYEFSPERAVEYLELAEDGMTAERMAVEIANTEEDRPLFADWIRFTAGLREFSDRLQNGYVPSDLPDEYKERAGYLAEGMAELASDVDKTRERIG